MSTSIIATCKEQITLALIHNQHESTNISINNNRFVFVLTFFSGFNANARANMDVMVLLPTPPLPDRISILCLTLAKRCLMTSIAGSGTLGAPDEQICWFGQPAQAEVLPASSLCVPGQSVAKKKYYEVFFVVLVI